MTDQIDVAISHTAELPVDYWVALECEIQDRLYDAMRDAAQREFGYLADFWFPPREAPVRGRPTGEARTARTALTRGGVHGALTRAAAPSRQSNEQIPAVGALDPSPPAAGTPLRARL